MNAKSLLATGLRFLRNLLRRCAKPAYFKKCVSLLVTACFLFNIAGVSVLAADTTTTTDAQKLKKEEPVISVLNTNVQMNTVADSMKPLKVSDVNTVSQNGKTIGTYDPKTGDISTLQQGKDGGQSTLQPNKILTEQYQKQNGKKDESGQSASKKTKTREWRLRKNGIPQIKIKKLPLPRKLINLPPAR